MLFLNRNDLLRRELRGGSYLKQGLNIFKKSRRQMTPEYKEEVRQLGLHNKADIKRFINKLGNIEKQGQEFIKKVEKEGKFGGARKRKSSKQSKSNKSSKSKKVIKRIASNMKPIVTKKKVTKKRKTKKSIKKSRKSRKTGGNYYFPDQGIVFLANNANLSKDLNDLMKTKKDITTSKK